MFRFNLFVTVFFVQYIFALGETECSQQNLRALNYERCAESIRVQYPWEVEEYHPDMCTPYQMYLMYDISNTVRRSGKSDIDLDMIEIQRRYFEILIKETQTNITRYHSFKSSLRGFPIKDQFFLTPYSTNSQILVEANAHDGLNSSLFWYLSDIEANLKADEELKEFYFGNNRGWSQVSNGYKAIREDLEYVEAELETNANVTDDLVKPRPVIILMTDGKPESRLGMTREARFMNRYAKGLKRRFNVHIHCVVMRFNQFGKGFWKKRGMCDSKQLFTRLSEVNASGVRRSMRAIFERKTFCESYVAPTVEPTLNPTTMSPTITPTNSPTENPTKQPTASPTEVCDEFEATDLLKIADLDLAGSTISVNNLGGNCGTDAVEGISCGNEFPQYVRYEGVLELDGRRVDLILSNSSLFTVKPQPGLGGTASFPIGKSGKFGEVQVRQASNVTLSFSFVDENDVPVLIPVLDFTVFDLDQGQCTCIDCDCPNCAVREVLTFNASQFHGTPTVFQFFENRESALCTFHEDEEIIVKSSVAGGVIDNPTDPTSLSDFARSVSILVRFFDVTNFDVNYKVDGGSLVGGRRLLFAGSSNVDPCPEN